jgi:hypothetical protein
MDEEIRILITNMPSILAMMEELKSLLKNTPGEDVNEFTVTAGKATFKLNKEFDKDFYERLQKTVFETSYGKIFKLRDAIDYLMYNSSDELPKEKKSPETL